MRKCQDTQLQHFKHKNKVSGESQHQNLSTFAMWMTMEEARN